MTNREYISQMTDEELAQWVITMNNYCKNAWLLVLIFFPKGATVRLGDANIYVDMYNDLVIDAE